ncbi:hypothetical protein SGPA1_10733 [Streptomyces misionensis JCM 4497]
MVPGRHQRTAAQAGRRPTRAVVRRHGLRGDQRMARHGLDRGHPAPAAGPAHLPIVGGRPAVLALTRGAARVDDLGPADGRGHLRHPAAPHPADRLREGVGAGRRAPARLHSRTPGVLHPHPVRRVETGRRPLRTLGPAHPRRHRAQRLGGLRRPGRPAARHPAGEAADPLPRLRGRPTRLEHRGVGLLGARRRPARSGRGRTRLAPGPRRDAPRPAGGPLLRRLGRHAAHRPRRLRRGHHRLPGPPRPPRHPPHQPGHPHPGPGPDMAAVGVRPGALTGAGGATGAAAAREPPGHPALSRVPASAPAPGPPPPPGGGSRGPGGSGRSRRWTPRPGRPG